MAEYQTPVVIPTAMPDNHYVFISRSSLVEADRACKLLWNMFHMASDARIHVVDLGGPDGYAQRGGDYSQRFACVMPIHYRSYTTTTEKMSSYLSDYMAGYDAAMAEVHHRELEAEEAAARAKVEQAIKKAAARVKKMDPKFEYAVVDYAGGGRGTRYIGVRNNYGYADEFPNLLNREDATILALAASEEEAYELARNFRTKFGISY